MNLQVTYDCHDMEAVVKKLFVMNEQRIDFNDEMIGTVGQYHYSWKVDATRKR